MKKEALNRGRLLRYGGTKKRTQKKGVAENATQKKERGEHIQNTSIHFKKHYKNVTGY